MDGDHATVFLNPLDGGSVLGVTVVPGNPEKPPLDFLVNMDEARRLAHAVLALVNPVPPARRAPELAGADPESATSSAPPWRGGLP